MSLKSICITATVSAFFSVAVSCRAAALTPHVEQPSPPDRCAVERVSSTDLEKMCAYDEISALATIALADELQFSLIWQQADAIMRAARHLDKKESEAYFFERHFERGANGGRIDQEFRNRFVKTNGRNVSALSVASVTDVPAKNVESDVTPLIGGCVQEMKVSDERWIEIVRATCEDDVNEALKIKLAHLYVPGPMNKVQGAKIRRRQVPDEGMSPPMRRKGGLSYADEEALLKERICLPYVAARYAEVCHKPLPDGYARLCHNGKTNADAVSDFWAQRQVLMIQNIVQKVRQLPVQGDGNIRRSRIYRLDIEGIEAAQNGLVDIEVCPKKTELIDLIAEALGGPVRKTQNGLIWDMHVHAEQ